MNTFKNLIAFTFLASLAAASFASSDWKLSKKVHVEQNNEKVYVYTRPIEGQILKQFKGTTSLDASLLTTFAVILDLPNVSNWMYNNKQSVRVEGSDGSMYLYVQIIGPSIVADRDGVLNTVASQDSGIITITNTSVTNQYPNQPGHIRMENVASKWVLKPISPTKTQITFTGHAEPGGWIPNWVANLVVTKMPSVTLLNLHKEVAKAEYKQISREQLNTELINSDNLIFE